MPIAPASTTRTRRRAVARVVCALLVVAGTAVISAPEANARPRNCNVMYDTLDRYWGYANAEFAVGDYDEGNRWLNAYYALSRRISEVGC